MGMLIAYIVPGARRTSTVFHVSLDLLETAKVNPSTCSKWLLEMGRPWSEGRLTRFHVNTWIERRKSMEALKVFVYQ